MLKRTTVFTLFAAAALFMGTTLNGSSPAGGFDPITHVNYLTFSKPVALPGVVLPAGRYTFEAGPGGRSRDIVMVMSRDGRGPLYLGFTREVRRPAGMPVNSTVSFGEAPADQPVPIAAWFPIGQESGHQFLYR